MSARKLALLALVLAAGAAPAGDASGPTDGLKAGTRIVYKTPEGRYREEILGVTTTTLSTRLVELDAAGAPIESTASVARDVPIELARLARVHDPRALDLRHWAGQEDKARTFDVGRFFGKKPSRQETLTISGAAFECAVYQRVELACVQRNGASLTVMKRVEHWVSPRYPFTLKVLEDQDTTFSVEERN